MFIILLVIVIAIALLLNEIEDVQEDITHAKYLGQKHCLRYTASIKVRGGWKTIQHGRWSKCWKEARKAAEAAGGAPIWVFPSRQ